MTEGERIRAAIVGELEMAAVGVSLSQRFLDRAVEDARQKRISWGAIGKAVGMTRQGARQRWGL